MNKRTSSSEVAMVYLDASNEGRPPTKAVAELFGIPHGTAARWVASARGDGLLPPATKGASPQRNAKLAKVAARVGVDYDALREAVLAVGGDLRVSG